MEEFQEHFFLGLYHSEDGTCHIIGQDLSEQVIHDNFFVWKLPQHLERLLGDLYSKLSEPVKHVLSYSKTIKEDERENFLRSFLKHVLKQESINNVVKVQVMKIVLEDKQITLSEEHTNAAKRLLALKPEMYAKTVHGNRAGNAVGNGITTGLIASTLFPASLPIEIAGGPVVAASAGAAGVVTYLFGLLINESQETGETKKETSVSDENQQQKINTFISELKKISEGYADAIDLTRSARISQCMHHGQNNTQGNQVDQGQGKGNNDQDSGKNNNEEEEHNQENNQDNLLKELEKKLGDLPNGTHKIYAGEITFGKNKPLKQSKLYYLHPNVEHKLNNEVGGKLTEYFKGIIGNKGEAFAKKVIDKMTADIPDSQCTVKDDKKQILYQTDEKNVLCAVYVRKDDDKLEVKILKSSDIGDSGQNGGTQNSETISYKSLIWNLIVITMHPLMTTPLTGIRQL